jgi:pentapeptide repeat protein
MSRGLQEVLHLKPEEKNRLGKTLEKIQSVSEFLSKAASKAGKLGFVKAVEDAVPWVGALSEAAAESFGPVKFVVHLFSKLTEVREPAELAYLACTLAYERSVEQAVKSIDLPTPRERVSDGLERLHKQDQERSGEDGELFKLDHFSFGGALEHPFVAESDRILDAYSEAVGYSEGQRRLLLNEVHQRFVTNLKSLLSDGSTKDKFDPLLRVMTLGTGERAVYEALADHAEYQRWLFEEQRVFGKEPFTLAQVYVELDCGFLAWGKIADTESVKSVQSRTDPFLETEQSGGRHSLAETVLGLLGDPNLKDAIVVQGIAGSGKSSFTLWLCRELVRQGLRPIRVLLRDVILDRDLSLTDSLAKGVHLTDEVHHPQGLGYPRPEGLLPDFLFRQSVHFRGTKICPFVLILDGWDEISLSTSEGFRVRLSRMLDSLRTRFLRWREGDVVVRVILTGRPAKDVAETSFLLSQTPVLTLRPLKPERLEEFINKVAHRLHWDAANLEATGWKAFSPERLAPVLARYRHDFLQQGERLGEDKPLEVLGLPLLAYLALRLLSHPEVDIESAIARPTALFRGLVDLTCGKGGKPQDAPEDIDQQFRVRGNSLRELLWWTAAAMTIYGQEHISFEELRLRLKPAKIDLAARVEIDTEYGVLSQLMISYFFKGGHAALGCEFLHKSFREYLFAEGLVELLKKYGSGQLQSYPQRSPYWQDFSREDPRFAFSRELARWLAPQWLTMEVSVHIDELLDWEISRSYRPDDQFLGIGLPTEPISAPSWRRVRDALADLWDWWAEGVHLRPQPERDERENLKLRRTYAEDLIEWSMPLAIERSLKLPEPKRTTTMDSHLGDALFQLCSITFAGIARADGWNDVHGPLRWAKIQEVVHLRASADLWEHHDGDEAEGPTAERRWRLFSPGGPFFACYVARIQSAGWRPRGPFPRGCRLRLILLDHADLSGLDLSGCDLSDALLVEVNLKHANLQYSNLQRSNLQLVDLLGADLSSADFRDSLLLHVKDADFRNALNVPGQFERVIVHRHSNSR